MKIDTANLLIEKNKKILPNLGSELIDSQLSVTELSIEKVYVKVLEKVWLDCGEKKVKDFG